MLHALRSGDLVKADAIRAKFNILEALRNAHGPIPVLHHAVAGADIAATGPALPLLRELDEELQAPIKRAASELLAWNGA
jgi:dihydrodipicolinate synthase/N-acetylneuraminate lyase